MINKIGDTPEQLGSCLTADALVIDGRIFTKSDYMALITERDALTAQVEVLQREFKDARQTLQKIDACRFINDRERYKYLAQILMDHMQLPDADMVGLLISARKADFDSVRAFLEKQGGSNE